MLEALQFLFTTTNYLFSLGILGGAVALYVASLASRLPWVLSSLGIAFCAFLSGHTTGYFSGADYQKAACSLLQEKAVADAIKFKNEQLESIEAALQSEERRRELEAQEADALSRRQRAEYTREVEALEDEIGEILSRANQSQSSPAQCKVSQGLFQELKSK